MGKVKVQNWMRAITYYANSVEVVESVDDIVRIVKDKDRYPSPGPCQVNRIHGEISVNRLWLLYAISMA